VELLLQRRQPRDRQVEVLEAQPLACRGQAKERCEALRAHSAVQQAYICRVSSMLREAALPPTVARAVPEQLQRHLLLALAHGHLVVVLPAAVWWIGWS
jgi:hypothetical protein